MMKHCIFIALLYLIGCATPERVDFGNYMCPTYQEFKNMQNLSDTSKCKKIIKGGKVISGYEFTIDVHDSGIGGILPVSIQKSDGTSLKGFIMFPPVVF